MNFLYIFHFISVIWTLFWLGFHLSEHVEWPVPYGGMVGVNNDANGTIYRLNLPQINITLWLHTLRNLVIDFN